MERAVIAAVTNAGSLKWHQELHESEIRDNIAEYEYTGIITD